MSIKLLVADDSITIQKVIGIIFGGDDYSLTVVDNGKTAIEKAREVCPDVLLIDALMPGMTGYEVSEAVRATPALANKPILILTGSFEPFDEEKAKKCGADDFLAKPFESQQIISKVKELAELGLARENAALAAKAQSIPQMEPEPPAPVFAPTAEPIAEPIAEPAFAQQNEAPPVSTQS
ncbi:MAG: response regulator, partial [Pseudomonadota bacterium]